jgi:hypothetical protein
VPSHVGDIEHIPAPRQSAEKKGEKKEEEGSSHCRLFLIHAFVSIKLKFPLIFIQKRGKGLLLPLKTSSRGRQLSLNPSPFKGEVRRGMGYPPEQY